MTMLEALVLGLSAMLIVLAFFLGRNTAFTEVRNLCGDILNKTKIPFPDLWDIEATVNKQAYTQGRLDAIDEIFRGLARTDHQRETQ